MLRNEDIFSALRNAKETGSHTEVLRLVTNGASLTIQQDNKTPIQLARDLQLWKCITAIAPKYKINGTDNAKYGDALVSAIANGGKDQIEAAIALIEAGASLDWQTNHDGNQAIHLAIIHKNIHLLELLINKGASLTCINKAKQTPLQLAVSLGFWDGVALIANKRKADTSNQAQYTDALFAAIKAHKQNSSDGKKIDNLNVIKALIDAGADICAKNDNDKTPIQVATRLNLWDCVELIAKTKKSPQGDKANYGDPLVDAAKENREDTVKILLEQGASTTWTLGGQGYKKNRTLHWAVINKNIAILKLLIKHGATLSAKNKKGDKEYTPIQLAANLGYWKGVEAIADEKSAKEAGEDAQYDDALRRAVIADKRKTVIHLSKAGAKITDTCLFEAVKNDSAKMVETLLNLNADPLVLNSKGQTPFEFACTSGQWQSAAALAPSYKMQNKTKAGLAFIAAVAAKQLDIARSLLKAGASINETTRPSGYTPLHQTIVDKNIKALHFLLANHASLTITCANGETPIEQACRLGHWNIAQALIEHQPAKNKEEAKALHYDDALIHAIKGGNYTIAKWLLDNHASPNQVDSERGNICLYEAIKIKRADLVSLLIAYEANPNIRNKDGKSSRGIARQLKADKCLSAIKGDNHTTTDDVSSLAEISNALFNQLIDNAIEAKKIPETIEKMQVNDKKLLSNMLNELKTQQTNIKKSNSTLSTHALFNTTTQNKNVSILIRTINSLLNFPDQPIDRMAIITLQQQGMIEASHVIAYLDRQEKIAAYIERLHDWLDKFGQSLIETTWTVKNFWGNWVEVTDPDDRPTHVKDILVELNKLTKLSSQKDILNAYTSSMNILTTIPNSKRRHDNTKAYYRTKSNAIQNIRFYESAYTLPLANPISQVTQVSSFSQSKSVSIPSQPYMPANLYPDLNNTDISPPSYGLPTAPQMTTVHHYYAPNQPQRYASGYPLFQTTPYATQAMPQLISPPDSYMPTHTGEYQQYVIDPENLPLFQEPMQYGIPQETSQMPTATIVNPSVASSILPIELFLPSATQQTITTGDNSGVTSSLPRELTDTQFNAQIAQCPVVIRRHPLAAAYTRPPSQAQSEPPSYNQANATKIPVPQLL